MTDESVTLTFKPEAGPWKRITYEPVHDASGEFDYERIVEVYEMDAGEWQETGTERVTDPDLEIEQAPAAGRQGV